MAVLSDSDVVVIGAGAAGIAAARRLGSEVSVLVLEARGRIGGRAWTVAGPLNLPLDLGCGWLHSADRNPWTGIAQELGFEIDRTPPGWGTQLRNLGSSESDMQEFRDARAAFWQRLVAAAREPQGRAASALLDPDCRWNELLQAISSFRNGAELDRVSVHDDAGYDDSGVNWRVVEGYGATVAAYGASVPVLLETPVACIDHGATPLRIETARGTVRARAVIVTVPSEIIAREVLRFDPPLPEKVEAAAGVPLGLADKLFLMLDGPDDLPADSHVFGRPDRRATGSYHLRPFGWPLIEGYFGGELARELERDEAFAPFAIDELAGLFGSGMRNRLKPIRATAWGLDPDALGSYSHALPGRSDSHAALAAPVDDRLFFAGEACSLHDFSTAHGAYLTGRQAAEQVLAALRGRRGSQAQAGRAGA